MAYVGTYVIRSYDNFDNFIQDKYTLVPAAIIIGISVIMFIFGLVGCCATIRESKVGLSFVSVSGGAVGHLGLSHPLSQSHFHLQTLDELQLDCQLSSLIFNFGFPLAFHSVSLAFFSLNVFTTFLFSPVLCDHHADLCS